LLKMVRTSAVLKKKSNVCKKVLLKAKRMD